MAPGMIVGERRRSVLPERRQAPRGGRRPYDIPGQHPPVLVADAYEAARTSCARYFQILRFEVAEVARPAEAVALIHSGWVPHVVLADPASANAVLGHLASSPRRATPPVIVMTDLSEFTRHPGDGLLVKPFRLKTMVQTVRSVLRRAARARSRTPPGRPVSGV